MYTEFEAADATLSMEDVEELDAWSLEDADYAELDEIADLSD